MTYVRRDRDGLFHDPGCQYGEPASQLPLHYDVKMKMDNGELSAVLDGTIVFGQPITLATT